MNRHILSMGNPAYFSNEQKNALIVGGRFLKFIFVRDVEKYIMFRKEVMPVIVPTFSI
jgi:hypothetical protein